MSHIVTIIGASGPIGKALATQLLDNGVKIRAVARTAEKLAPLRAAGAEVYVGNIEDTAFLNETLRGTDAVFAMIPEHPNLSDFRTHKHQTAAKLAEAVTTAGVPRVVALSAIGVAPPSGIGPSAANGAFEEMLKSVPGLSVVALRAAFFMENLLASIPLIKGAGINGSPLHADVAIAMVATRDVAAAAAEYLMTPTFDGCRVHELLGPRDYTYAEATSIVGAAIDKPDLPYVEFPYEDFRKNLVGFGLSEDAADSLVELYTAFNKGDIQKMVCREASNTTPTTLEAFAHEVFAPVYKASM